MMYRRRVMAIARKEVSHIMRDPFTLAMALLMPLILVVLFGYAIDFDMKNVRLAIYDQDNTQASRVLSQVFTNSGYFVSVDAPWPANPEEALKSETAKAALIIPKEFEEYIKASRTAQVQILIDGADNSVIGTILYYLNGVLKSATYKLAPDRSIPPIKIVTRYLFNPEQKSPWFIVPGLSVVILAILSILLTAMTVAREWETGSMELLLSTPVRPLEIVLGKILPYIAMGFVGAAFVYVAARLVFQIPFVGSHALFALGTFLFLGTYLSLGLLISAIAKRQQLAMQMALIAGYLPATLLSGFIFSIQNMPSFWQYFTMLMPARWYMTICRSCYLKGSNFLDLSYGFAAMLMIWIVLMFFVVRKFTGRLE